MQFLWKGFLIGILFGIPVGTVGTMTIQKTLTHGFWTGVMTGLGSSAADCFYAFVGAFGLTVISDFLLKYERLINILGGSMLLFMGIHMLIKNEKKRTPQPESGAARTFFPSFLIGITNPVAILTFLFAFTYFKIPSHMNLSKGFFLVFGVLLGTLFWWVLLSASVEAIKNKKLLQNFRYRNQAFGVLYILFGIAVFIRAMNL